MQSKVSWFKKGILLQDLRSIGWIGILYLVTLLFMLPLQIVMMHETNNLPYRYVEYNSLFAIVEGFQFFLMFTVPVLLGVALFRYLHVKGSADFIHSLPVKREELYIHHVAMGIILLVVPILITGLVVGVVQNVLQLESYFTFSELVKWVSITSLLYLFVFLLTVLIGTVTGISAVQVVLTYILLLFPTGIMVLFNFNIKYFIFGFASDYYFDQNIEYLTPILRVTQIPSNGMSGLEAFVYSSFGVLFFVLGILAYKKRKMEGATQAIAFSWLKPVFKYGVTFCFMLLSGMYFGETQRGDLEWLIFGYFFGSILGYIIAEMILQKTWRVFKNVKGYIGYVVVVTVFGLLLHLDITGYEKKVPGLSEVDRAYFGYNVFHFDMDDNAQTSMAHPNQDLGKFLHQSNLNFLDEDKNIQHIIAFHEKLVHDRNFVDNDYPGYYQNISIGYILDDGEKLIRQYRIPENSYKEFVKPIYESEEYKFSNNELLRLKENVTIDKIRITSHNMVQKQFETVDKNMIEDMVHHLQQDMLQESYEDMFTQKEAWGDIELLLENNMRLHLAWKKSYTNFDQLIREAELTNQVRVVPSDIEYAVVFKNNHSIEAPHKYEYETQLKAYEEEIKNGIRIEDPVQMEKLLQESTWHTDKEYLIGFFVSTSDQPMIKGIVNSTEFLSQMQ